MSIDTDYKRGFGSDNHAGVHPEIMKALVEVDRDHAPSYGTDDVTKKATEAIRNIVGDFGVFFVFNGTAANVLSIQSHLQSYNSIIASDISHMNVDECGAPEKIAGVKLIPAKSIDGKLTVEEIKKHKIRMGDQHFSQVKMVSITQPTEVGTTYSLDELNEIAQFCKENNLLLHCDGTRFFNACIHLDANPKTMASYFDVISLGGTKNGFMMGEAVLIKDHEIAKSFKFFRKQALQLPSKTRYIAAQFERYFKDDLYLDIARSSTSMATKLSEALSGIKQLEILYPVQSNAVFAKFPREHLKAIREKFFFYV